jgi:hypothetical protein
VAEFVSSGMRRSEFCQSRGLSFSTLDRHKKLRWKRGRKPISSAGRLVPVELAARKSPTQQKPSCGIARVVKGQDGSVRFNSTISPRGTSSLSRAAIPESLMSKVRPFSTPHVTGGIISSTALRQSAKQKCADYLRLAPVLVKFVDVRCTRKIATICAIVSRRPPRSVLH